MKISLALGLASPLGTFAVTGVRAEYRARSLTADFQGFFSATANYLRASAVLCLLPPSGGGFIRSIEVSPYFPIQ